MTTGKKTTAETEKAAREARTVLKKTKQQKVKLVKSKLPPWERQK